MKALLLTNAAAALFVAGCFVGQALCERDSKEEAAALAAQLAVNKERAKAWQDLWQQEFERHRAAARE